MKLAIIGTGYVGLITGACFAEFGYQTVCIDKDQDRINELNNSKCPFYEPGVDTLLDKHLNKTKLLSFSNSLSKSISDADIIFITVGTPSKRIEGEADLSYVWDVAEEISNHISKYCIVVTKSTVPVGTTKEVKNIISKKINEKDFDVVSNPEFLREGSALNDFMRPDRVVIGCENKKSEDIMRNLYRPLYLLETPIVSTTVESAEIIKYASNSFLATKISFINQVADLCEKVGADVQDVAKGMGIDKRIGDKFLHAGPGYGGSCFPKDTHAIAALSIEKSVPTIDSIAVEIPLQTTSDRNDRKLYGTLMRTPGKDMELIIGLMISSGDLLVNEQIPEVTISSNSVHVAISNIHSERLLNSTSSCGICGRENVEIVPIPD